MTQQPMDIQVAIDCEDPHELARWWAEALGWEVETQDEAFIQSMLDQGMAQAADVLTFRGSLVWKMGAAINHPGGHSPRLLFQEVPELKTTKNRVHWDLRTATGDSDPHVVERLIAMGATRIGEGQQGRSSWVLMEDPEGNEFCV